MRAVRTNVVLFLALLTVGAILFDRRATRSESEPARPAVGTGTAIPRAATERDDGNGAVNELGTTDAAEPSEACPPILAEAPADSEDMNGPPYRVEAPDILVIEVLDQPNLVEGEQLIRRDGTVRLGRYGSMVVSGMTLEEVKLALEKHFAEYLSEPPEVFVDLGAYNSKVVYVHETGRGESAWRIPYTGTETVLDLLSEIEGLEVAPDSDMWLTRPAPEGGPGERKMAIDWCAILRDGGGATNYHLLPGDHLHFKFEVKKHAADNRLIQNIEAALDVLTGAIDPGHPLPAEDGAATTKD